MRRITTALLALACMAASADSIEITEWTVPYETSRPRDPFAVSADSVWFVGQRAGYLARLDVTDGSFEKIDLKDGSGPHNLIVQSNGDVWYAGNRTTLIGRYEPDTGAIEEVPMPDPKARDPHTLIFDADESHIFFTVQGGNMMGRLTLATRKVDLIPSSSSVSGSMWASLLVPNSDTQMLPSGASLMP